MESRRETIVKMFSITDEMGTKHEAILVGLLDISKYLENYEDKKTSEIRGKTITTTTTWSEKEVFKMLSIGLAITNPVDIFNYDKGVLIASGRAMKTNKQIGVIYSESKGMLGTEMVNSILEQQKKFILENPGLFFKCKCYSTEELDLPF
jgi:hypothetical protein